MGHHLGHFGDVFGLAAGEQGGDQRRPLERREVSRAALLALALVLSGCGGGGRGAAHGTATLWVTHDRGARVVFSGPVPAGLVVTVPFPTVLIATL